MTTRVKDNDTFITLIRVAQGDPDIRRQLVTILSLDKSQRNPALHTFIDEMKLQQKPQEFVAAVTCLLVQDVADKTLNIIRNELGADPRLTESVGKQLIFAVKLFTSIPVTAAIFGFVIMGIFVGLKEIGIIINPIFGLPMAFLAFVVGAVVGGTIVTNRSGLLIAAIAVVDTVVIVVLNLMKNRPPSI